MKKSLLIGLLGVMTAASASAFEANEYVYTNQGRFQITDATNLYTGSFGADGISGWTAVSATEGTQLSALFGAGTDETYGASIQPLTNVKGEGMCYSYTPTDASAPFVVSMKIKGTAESAGVPLLCTHVEYSTATDHTCVADGSNIVKLVGVTDTSEVVINSAVEIAADWSTIAFGYVPTGEYNSYKLYLEALNTSIMIADVQIQTAMQVANLKQRDQVLKYADAFAAANPAAVTADYTENYNNVKDIIDESAQSDLEDAITGLQDIISTEIKPSLDDQLTVEQSRFGTWSKVQKASTWGEWTCYPAGRGFCTAGDYPDFGHYTGYAYWGYDGTGATPMGISMNIALEPGKYVFVTNARGNAREMKSSKCWDYNFALNYVHAVMCAVNAAGDTIATTGFYPVSPLEYTQNVLSFDVAEAGTYTIWMASYANENDLSAMLGGALYLKDVEFYGKTSAKFSKAQVTYYTNVQTQVTTGRDALTKAAEYQASADYKWAKADLKACCDSIESRIADYEVQMKDSATIIASMPEEYTSGTTSDSISGMEAIVYQNATKYILAANKEFLAKNDTLTSLATAIAGAQTTLNKRIYGKATYMADFKAEIAKAQELLATLQAADYSEENADAIVAENAALATAADLFTASVPASSITDIIDIDFSNPAVVEDETAAADAAGAGTNATISGNKGSMVFTNFSTVSPTSGSNCPYELGLDNNGDKDSAQVLRYGSGVATVAVQGAPVNVSDIVTVSFDYFFGLLSGKNSGYYVLSEQGDTICGLVVSKYSGTSVLNTFNVDFNNNITGVGSSSASNAAIAASSNATHFTIVLDYGTGMMYCTTSGTKGTFTSDEVAFNTEKKIGSYVLYSNYNNYGRRGWFDNLKVQNYSVGDVVYPEGDVNKDLKVNVLDVNTVIKNIIGGTATEAELDKVVNIILGK